MRGGGAGDVQRAGGGRGKVSVSTGLRTRPDVTQRSDTTSDRGWRLCNNLEGAGQRSYTCIAQCDTVCSVLQSVASFPELSVR